jgi:hypothetical protein
VGLFAYGGTTLDVPDLQTGHTFAEVSIAER